MAISAITLLASTVATAAPIAPMARMPPVFGATRVATPPTIDGVLDDAAWNAAPATDLFTQKFPDEGSPPAEPTKLRVLYDDSAIYVAFDCTEVGGPIVAPLTRRDRRVEADAVAITFDSRGDGRSAFEFWISASGVMGDTIRFDDVEQSTDWDEVWEGKVARTDHGWSAELKIPLRALRFRRAVGGTRTFGMQARRYLSRRKETDEWAFIPRAVAGEVSHYGRLEGLTAIEPTGSIEARVSVVGGIEHRDPSVSVLGSGFSPLWGIGADIRWHVTPGLTLDATFFPDFAQVEADQVVLNLTSFEIQYPEKRPFFLEGIDIFNTPIQLLYTRRIGHAPPTPTLLGNEAIVDSPVPSTIYGATKLQGELAPGWTYGSLAAVTGAQSIPVSKVQLDANGNAITRPDGSVIPVGQSYARTIDPLTAYEVLRLKRAIGDHAYVGAMATMTERAESASASVPYDSATQPTEALCSLTGDVIPYGRRCWHDSYVGSIDGRWRSAGGDYQALGQVAESRIVGGETRTLLDGTRIGDGDMGLRARAMLAKEGGAHVTWNASYDYASRKVDYNDLGYMGRQAMHQGDASVAYRTLEPVGPTLETHTTVEVSASANLDGLWLDRSVSLESSARFKNYWESSAGTYYDAARFDDREVGDGTALERAARVGAWAWVGGDSRKPVRPSVWSNLELYSGGYKWQLEGGVRALATPQLALSIRPSLLFTSGEPRFAEASNGQNVFGVQTAASVGAIFRATYTFTPTLTLQAYAQLFLSTVRFDQLSTPATSNNVVHRSDLQPLPAGTMLETNPDSEQGTLNVNVVLRWEYRPGSTVYVVYTRAQVPSVTLGQAEVPTLSLGAIGRAPASDAVLVKVAYWVE